MVRPGSIIGILGGGQLGRMTVLAAARLGYRCHVFCEDSQSPALHVAYTHTIARFDDRVALETFARSVDVVTFEWENIPLDLLHILTQTVEIHPNLNVLAITQDRILEKQTIERNGHQTAPWYPVSDLDALHDGITTLGRPAILKTSHSGYDGKGQILIQDNTDLTLAWNTLNTDQAILESMVPFTRELSVIIARNAQNQTAIYPVGENHHVDYILKQTIAPVPITTEQAMIVHHIAYDLARSLEVIGLLTVELFQTSDGRFIVNELAPRPHNSGHWTIDACATSQFEQLIRAICGLPLGCTDASAKVVMENLIGNEVAQWPRLFAMPDARVHLYGKQEIRAKRKMGHVTWVQTDQRK